MLEGSYSVSVDRATLNLAASPNEAAPFLQTQRRRLRVVVVDEELPYPLNSGKRIRRTSL